ncbi:hypothetical protein KJ854_00115 [Patescibacteria group bacterium]|nr:hypothetical protein [Patescibacteria group bacterium]MBU4141656.1 hypothetical protein [Patescibacteria group bacterium]
MQNESEQVILLNPVVDTEDLTSNKELMDDLWKSANDILLGNEQQLLEAIID